MNPIKEEKVEKSNEVTQVQEWDVKKKPIEIEELEIVKKELDETKKNLKLKTEEFDILNNSEVEKDLRIELKEKNNKINELTEIVKNYEESETEIDVDDILSFQSKYYNAKKKLEEIKIRYQIEIPDTIVVKRPIFKTKLAWLQYDYRILSRASTKPWFWGLKDMKNLEQEILVIKAKKNADNKNKK